MDIGDEHLWKILVQDIEQIMEDYQYPDLGRAFQHWAAINVLGLSDDDVEDEIKGTMTRDYGIDYFNVNEDGCVVEILQAKFSGDFSTGVSSDDLSMFFEVPDRLMNGNGSSSFQVRQASYRDAIAKKFTTKLFFVVTGTLTAANIDEINRKTQHLPEYVEFECLEIKDLLGLIGNRNSKQCSLKVLPGEIFISHPANGQIKKMVATVQAKELKKIYDQIGATTLFSVNPRYFLGGKISKGIVETLQQCPERMWHYNNGISAVCKDFRYDEMSNTLIIENIKIVNGCQTVTTLAKHKGTLPSDATIMLRISEVDSKDFSEKISANTNTQNRIRDADKWSDKPPLIILESKFKQHYRDRFFWERKKGSLKSIDSKERCKYTKGGLKKLRVLENVTAARLKLAFRFEAPHMSIQASEAKIFSISLFSKIYDGADPLDFIFPNIFWYLLSKIKADTSTDTSDGSLLHVRIGMYYVVAMIGKIFRSLPNHKSDAFTRGILNAVDDPDLKSIDDLTSKLRLFVKAIAVDLESVLDNNKRSLSDYTPSELRDELRGGVLERLYKERKNFMTRLGKDPDLFVQDLEKIFGDSGSNSYQNY